MIYYTTVATVVATQARAIAQRAAVGHRWSFAAWHDVCMPIDPGTEPTYEDFVMLTDLINFIDRFDYIDVQNSHFGLCVKLQNGNPCGNRHFKYCQNTNSQERALKLL
mmetsp:Transcript_32234/g.78352  ORF Transcript_32234/g.78352 Transcript_32234/m.78352 type:complete len:108 (+) Transcript_32234:478-801(+)